VRREEILAGISQVVAALRQTAVSNAIKGMLSPRDESMHRPEALEGFKQYLLAAQRYNSVAETVAKTFGFDRLVDAKFWTAKSNEELHRFYFKLQSAEELLPRLAELIRPEEGRLASTDTAAPEKGRDSILTLVLPEEAHQHSRPERISQVLLGITAIYEVLATMEAAPENTLVVLGCDSGSDKSFDLLGLSKIVVGVKEIILSLWDRIVFHRELQVAQRLEVISASLPVLEKLSVMEKQEKFGPEQAELLRRKILEGINQFVSSGATIPEMAARGQFEPRKLMAPAPKLLTTGSVESMEKAAPPSRSRKKAKNSNESS